jgi:hypothetical protein
MYSFMSAQKQFYLTGLLGALHEKQACKVEYEKQTNICLRAEENRTKALIRFVEGTSRRLLNSYTTNLQ